MDRNTGRPTTTENEQPASPDGVPPGIWRPEETDELKRLAASRRAGSSLFQGPLVRRAAAESFRKLDPRTVARNPVMFVVEVGAVMTSGYVIQQILTGSSLTFFTFQVAV